MLKTSIKGGFYVSNKKIQNLEIYIVRITKTGITKYSKPCKDCIELIKKFSVKKIYYTTGDYMKGEWKCEKTSTIVNNHLCSRRRHNFYN